MSGVYIGRLREGDVDEWGVQGNYGRGRSMVGNEGDRTVFVQRFHVQAFVVTMETK